jgi:hypothetical protein
VVNPEIPEWAVGYEESLLLGWIAERGLTLTGKDYGGWCGRDRFMSYQDILVYQKKVEGNLNQQRTFRLRDRGLGAFFRGSRWGRRSASA